MSAWHTNLTKDEIVPKSVGVKWKNIDIRFGNETVHLVEGTYIQNKEVIAGKGRARKIDEIDGLVKTFGGRAENWVKMKGQATVVDSNGKVTSEELHWYEEPSVGKVKVKVKIK